MISFLRIKKHKFHRQIHILKEYIYIHKYRDRKFHKSNIHTLNFAEKTTKVFFFVSVSEL